MAVKESIVKKGDKIKVDYTGTFDDGTVFDSSQHGEHSHPLEFEAGAGQVIKGFDESVLGMKLGEEKNIKINPSEGYGDANPALVKNVPKDKFPQGQDIKAGMMLALATPDGKQFPAIIKEVNENEVVIDLNHPLAGKNLSFKIKLVGIC